MNNKARHNLIDAKCRWRSDWLDGAGSNWEPLGQTKAMQIRQRETQIPQGVITHEICCLAAQCFLQFSDFERYYSYTQSVRYEKKKISPNEIADIQILLQFWIIDILKICNQK